METAFHILVHVKTPEQLQTIGKFYIGNDRQFSYALFNQLKGRPSSDGPCGLYFELMETLHNLPANILMLSCTLNELKENCGIITLAVFRQFNLEESGAGESYPL